MQRLTNSVITTDGDRVIRGLAAPYYDGTPATETVLPDGIIERIMPGAWTDCVNKIKSGEMTVHCYFNHNPDKALGATPKTLEIWESKEGLNYSNRLDSDDPDAQKLLRGSRPERQEFKGSSFGANADKRSIRYSRENGRTVRSIHRFNSMWDVSPVYLPVYSNSGFTIRSHNELMKELEEIKAEAAAYFELQERLEETRKRIERNKNLR